MVCRQTTGAMLALMLCCSLVTSTLAASMDAEDARKFVSKPNNIKKQQLIQQGGQSPPAKQVTTPEKKLNFCPTKNLNAVGLMKRSRRNKPHLLLLSNHRLA